MTRMRMSHNYHEVKVHSPETRCSKCGMETPKVCEWCGACHSCHKGAQPERRY